LSRFRTFDLLALAFVRNRAGEFAKPMLYLGRRQRGALYGAKRGHDVGINAGARVGPVLRWASSQATYSLTHSRTVYDPTIASPRQICKPRARRFLRLSEGQDVLAVRIGDVVGRSDRPMASTMVGAVVPRDPRPAFGAPPVSDRPAPRRSVASRVHAEP